MRQVVAAVDSFSSKMPTERVYLHFDKPYYAVGDTVWFKAYLVDASRASSTQSSILYVELFNDSNTIVKKLALPTGLGLARGDFILSEKDIAQGVYGIRAYTQWMRNFGEAFFYYKYFYIGQLTEGSMLVDEQHHVSGEGKDATARLTLRLTDLNRQPIRDHEFQVSVLDRKKSIYRERQTSSPQGLLTIDCELPAQRGAKNIAVVLEDRGRGGKTAANTDGANPGAANTEYRRTVVPVYLNRPENADLQFTPGGGALVGGLPAHMGFRATGEDGRGVDVKGTITDSKNKRVTSFTALHRGTGSFDFIPQLGETYTVRASLGGGPLRDYRLPATKESGTVLSADAISNPDSLAITVYFSSDLIDGVQKYLFIGQARGTVCYGAILIANKASYTIHIPKAAFPTGIVRLSLLSSDRQPLNERLLFVDRQDPLHIVVTTDAGNYGPRDSVALHFLVTDATGKPVSSSLSLSVTDETQVKEDSVGADNICARLLLSSDLESPVEDPAWYFRDKDSTTLRALDNLLVTRVLNQRDWKKVFDPLPAPAFLAQTEFTIRGRALNVFNKPIKKTHVALLGSRDQALVKDTITNDQGVFVFDKFPPFDTATYFIQAKNRNGKDFNVGIVIDEPAPASLDATSPFPVQPWYVNGDNTFAQYMALNASYRKEQEEIRYPGRGKVLPTVTVRGKKSVQGSRNLNGAGNADQVLDEEEMQKDGKATLLQILEKEINGFHAGSIRRSPQLLYMIHENRVRFIFDGINLNFAMPGADYFTVRDYLQSYTAEDIKGIEVMYNPGYTTRYDVQYTSARNLLTARNAYLEITTRSGRGPYQSHTAGTWLYKPQPFYFARPFYRTRYVRADEGSQTTGTGSAAFRDLRSTIHWSSDIITDTTGHATISFFTADRPAMYRVIVEGSDMNGLMGHSEKEIEVKKP